MSAKACSSEPCQYLDRERRFVDLVRFAEDLRERLLAAGNFCIHGGNAGLGLRDLRLDLLYRKISLLDLKLGFLDLRVEYRDLVLERRARPVAP